MVREAHLASHADDAALVRGRVTDADGAPLHPARVLLVHSRWVSAQTAGWRSRPSRAVTPPAVHVRTAIDVSGTDADGHFVVREPAGSERGTGFLTRLLVAEYGGRGRTLEIEGRSRVEVALPETRELDVVARTAVRAAVASPDVCAFVRVRWLGRHGEVPWSTSPLAPSGSTVAVDPASMPYSRGQGCFAAVASSSFEGRVDVPVGEVSITVFVSSAGRNHQTLAVSADGTDARRLEIAVPHPRASRLVLELSPSATGSTIWGFFVWDYPDMRQWVTLEPGARGRYVLEGLPPGRYFVGPGTEARSRCRRSLVLAPDAEQTFLLDTSGCVARGRPPH